MQREILVGAISILTKYPLTLMAKEPPRQDAISRAIYEGIDRPTRPEPIRSADSHHDKGSVIV